MDRKGDRQTDRVWNVAFDCLFYTCDYITSFQVRKRLNVLIITWHKQRSITHRVRKSENFPDSKIFVTKTFRMMRVNCFNFQICDKCAEGCVCKILSIRMVKICPMGYIYNGHYLHLSTFLNTLIENMQNSIQETSRHLFRSSGHFQIIWIHFLDTF